jgi:hypothetical protein
MRLSGGHWAAVGTAIVAGASGLAYVLLRKGVDEDVSEDPTQPEAPDALALAAGVSLEMYCLARSIASEEGGQPRLHQQAVGCALVNFARSEFPRLADADAVIQLVLGSAGQFGRQGSGGRRVSSARAPIRLQLELAADILAGQLGDPTSGATQWDSPKGQRALLKQGDPLTQATPQQIADTRMAHGYELVVVPGIDPDDLRFWRRA